MGEVIWILSICYLLLFLISIKIKDNSIVDVFWGTGFLIVVGVMSYLSVQINIIETIFIIVFFMWGLRLTYHIGKRKLHTNIEDPRYGVWRQEWKYFYLRSFFQVYLLQFILLLIISTPLFFIFSGDSNLNNYAYIGICIMILGLTYEAIADMQLKNFLQINKQKNTIFTQGLYKYSRYPNYLGESIFWLGVSIVSLQHSLYGIIGFLMITTLLLFVSGVPMQEKRHKNKQNWGEYSQKTPKFIPNFFIK